MTKGEEVFIMTSTVVDLVKVAQGIQIYKGKVRDYNSEKVVVEVKTEEGETLLTSVNKEIVYLTFQAVLEACQSLLTEPKIILKSTLTIEENEER